MAISELLHNKPEQVREYLQTALDLTAELAPLEDLRVAFFEAAVGLCAAKQMVIQQPRQVGLPPGALAALGGSPPH